MASQCRSGCGGSHGRPRCPARGRSVDSRPQTRTGSGVRRPDRSGAASERRRPCARSWHEALAAHVSGASSGRGRASGSRARFSATRPVHVVAWDRFSRPVRGPDRGIWVVLEPEEFAARAQVDVDPVGSEPVEAPVVRVPPSAPTRPPRTRQADPTSARPVTTSTVPTRAPDGRRCRRRSSSGPAR
jgi:hypothetical protein